MPIHAPTSFRSQAAFRAWLRRNHSTTPELLVRLYKAHAANRGLTYAQARDEALCFGWIDGVRRRLDDNSFSIRFTPRRPRSTWSKVNVAHVQRLIRDGRMQAPGLIAFQARTAARTGLYSFERGTVSLRPAYARQFRADRTAWDHFRAQAPSYRRTSIFWVMDGKREETRVRRLLVLIECSRSGRRIPLLARS